MTEQSCLEQRRNSCNSLAYSSPTRSQRWRLLLLMDAARVGKVLDPEDAGNGPRLIIGVFTGTYVTRRA